MPPEAKKLAKKIEDILAKMIGDAVKSKIGVDDQLKNLEITVYEELFRGIKETHEIFRKKIENVT